MSIYLKLTGRTFTIWLLTAFLNGLLAGIAISIIGLEFDQMAGNCILAGILSLAFSVPGFFIFGSFCSSEQLGMIGRVSYSGQR